MSTPPLGVEEDRRRLPELLERAAAGEAFVIQRHKKPMAALVAFLADAKGTDKYLTPLMQGIAQGTWQGVISSVSLARVLEGPLARGDELLAQRYANAFANPQHWLQVPADGALVLAATRLQRQEPQLDDTRALELATAIATDATVLVTDHPALAQTGQHPILSALQI